MLPRRGAGLGPRLYLAGFFFHFALVLLVGLRETFSVLAIGQTFLPPSSEAWLKGAAAIGSAAIGENLSPSHPWRGGISFYTHCTGIDTGYGFFAPNVSISHKLVFELHYADGRVDYELPGVGGVATGVRLPLLLDNIAHARDEDLRKTMLKMMAFSIRREHRDADFIRAVFGFIKVPGILDFENGKDESYGIMFAYDFRFAGDGVTDNR